MTRKVQFCCLSMLILICFGSVAQNSQMRYSHEDIQKINKQLPLLQQKDFNLLMNIPPLSVNKTLVNTTVLPAVHDNSTNMYMRPVFHQIAYECGQAAGIGYTFTYEINRLRNLSSAQSANQYPTHFAWNFMNFGATTGVNCIEAWELVKGAGTPNVVDYGGMTSNIDKWISGYPVYYNGMSNRVIDWSMIECGTPEGLKVLKTWLYNHLENSAIGGIANFYANLQSNTYLPTNTPWGGSCVVTQWAPSVNHCMTIVGYNDSIRYDYNNDGLYTNNIDITGDGVVDMKDWEIGGLKFVNSYGTGYYDQGYAFMMYKTLADAKVDGGIWNNRVFVVTPKPSYEPKLTFKVNMKHDRRSCIKITAGVATDTASPLPFFTMEFPVFNYQGGNFYMQGGNSAEANKTIEFGLDITPLLNYVQPGDNCKFFLMIDENDPSAQGTGSLLNLSLIDYTSGILEIPLGQSNIPLTENGVSVFGISKIVTRPEIEITDIMIPEATIYNYWEHQFIASGGTPPYTWRLQMDYDETPDAETFPQTTAQQLTVTNTGDGYAVKELEFEFPFYGKKYTKMYVHVDGYIMFDDQQYPWPFALDELTMMKSTRNISPYNSRNLIIGSGDGIWYEGNASYALFRWKTSIYNFAGTTDLNFAAKLFPDGTIEFYYGNITTFDYIYWYSGISNGDMFNNHMTWLSNVYGTTNGSKVILNPQPAPLGLEMTLGGLLHGTPTEDYNALPLNIYVEDKYGFQKNKMLNFTTNGFKIDYSLNSGGDDSLQYAENALMQIQITNIGNSNVSTGIVKLETSNPYITLTDDTESFSNIPPGAILTVPGAFAFTVSELIPNEIIVPFTIKVIVPGSDTIQRTFEVTAWAPHLVTGDVIVEDGGNHSLDPGENSDVVVTLQNKGGARVDNLVISLGEWSPYITLNTSTASISHIESFHHGSFTMNLDVSPLCPLGTVVQVNMYLTADHQVVYGDEIFFVIGQTGEDFESGTFDEYPWQMGGDADWYLTDSLPYEGNWCARSADINDNDESFMFVSMNILTNGNIRFQQRVSCEPDATNHNYDYLAFYVDGAEKGRWDGEHGWAEASFGLEAGFRTLKWRYRKDYSVSTGKDAVWVDDILFPPNGDPVSVSSDEIPDESSLLVSPNPFKTGTVLFYRMAEAGPLRIDILDLQGNLITTLTDNPKVAAGIHDFRWECEPGLAPGVYIWQLRTTNHTLQGKLIKTQ